jgi:cytochrome P450
MIWSDGDDWRENRRLAQPLFHERVMGRYAHGITTGIDGLIERLDGRVASGEPFDLYEEMIRFTLRTLYLSVFNQKLPIDHDKGELMTSFFDVVGKVFWSLLYSPMGMTLDSSITRLKDVRALVDREIDEIIRLSAERALDEQDDLIKAFVGNLSDQQLRDEVLTVFLAGAETTSNLMVWLAIMLGRHPEERALVDKELQDLPNDQPVRFDMLGKLSCLQSAIRETMRLFPPVWMVGRKSTEDTDLNGRQVCMKDWLLVFVYQVHRNPEIWTDPDRFLPERFRKEPDGPVRHAYVPFGGGRHLCLGKHFAEHESLLAAASVFRRFSFEFEPGSNLPLESWIGLTLKPREVIVRARHV